MNRDPKATKIGLLDTRTTELATEVYFSELIQARKCRARKSPLRSESPRSRLESCLSPSRLCQANGVRSSVARTKR